MDRVSDERLEELAKIITVTYMGIFDRDILSALTELRERREADETKRKNQCSICGGKHSCEEHL